MPLRDAYHYEAQAALAVAVLTALAALVFVGQALARQVRREWADADVLRSIGLSPRQAALAAAGRGLIIGVGAALVAGAFAIGLSPVAPIGHARQACARPRRPRRSGGARHRAAGARPGGRARQRRARLAPGRGPSSAPTGTPPAPAADVEPEPLDGGRPRDGGQRRTRRRRPPGRHGDGRRRARLVGAGRRAGTRRQPAPPGRHARRLRGDVGPLDQRAPVGRTAGRARAPRRPGRRRAGRGDVRHRAGRRHREPVGRRPGTRGRGHTRGRADHHPRPRAPPRVRDRARRPEPPTSRCPDRRRGAGRRIHRRSHPAAPHHRRDGGHQRDGRGQPRPRRRPLARGHAPRRPGDRGDQLRGRPGRR